MSKDKLDLAWTALEKAAMAYAVNQQDFNADPLVGLDLSAACGLQEAAKKYAAVVRKNTKAAKKNR